MPYYIEVARKKAEDIFILAVPFYLAFNLVLLATELVLEGFNFKVLSLILIILAVSYQYRIIQDNNKKYAKLRQQIERDISQMRDRQIRELIEIMDNDAIGDISCEFNAVSMHLQCAVNPQGNCKTCTQYKSRGTEKNV